MGDGKFKPGAEWRGNAGGRPKATIEIIELARESVPLAIEKAKALLESDDEAIVLAAGTFLRDTGVGRPRPVKDLSQCSDEELTIELIRRKREREHADQRGIDASSPGLLHS